MPGQSVRIGALRHRITLQNPSAVASDGDGGFTQTWTTIASRVSASVDPAMVSQTSVSGRSQSMELRTANTVTSRATHLIMVRYRSGITTKTRVVFHDGATDRAMSITGIYDTEERHNSLVLECVEVVQ